MNTNECPDYTLAKDFPLSKEQNEMIDFGIRRPQAVLSGQTGIGKTLAVLTAALHLLIKNKELYCIIVCPPKALLSFQREMSEKLKVSYSIISTDDKSINDKSRIILISNTCLDKSVGILTKIYNKGHKMLLILDESHQCTQRPSNKLYKTLILIRKLFCIAWFTTATSCKNNIEGMFYMLSLLNPNILGPWPQFRAKYIIYESRNVTMTTKTGAKIKKRQEEIVGYRNLEELQGILNQFIIVRQKQYNIKFNYHKTQLNKEEVKNYIRASNGKLSEKAKDFWSVRLRDITFVVDNIHDNVEQERLSNKERLLLKVLLDNQKAGRPSIIYCEYIDVLDRLEFLINTFKHDLMIDKPLIIKGGVSLKDRKAIETEISIRKPCIITSAGGESINLQRANTIIFYDLPYDIAQIIQVIGRITRVDTKFGCQYVDIIEAFGTTDTYKRLCMEKNMKLIENLFGKMNTLPYTTYDNEQKFMKTLRNALLWAFQQGRLCTEEELQSIFERFDN